MVFGWKKDHANPLGRSRTSSHVTADGHSYRWHFKPRRQKSPPRSAVSAPASIAVEFEIRRENLWMRLAKWLGCTREFQTEDAAFDRRFYIFADEPQLGYQLLNPNMRRAIVQVFELGGTSIKTCGGGLAVSMKKAQAQPDPIIVDPLVAQLQEIRQYAERLARGESFLKWRAAAEQAKWIAGCMIAAVIAGVVGLVLEPYRLVDYMPLMKQAAMVAIAPAVLGFLLIKSLFQHSSQGVKALTAYVTAGIPAICIASYLGLYYINLYYDDSPPVIRAYPVISGNIVNDSKKGKRYYLYIRHWAKPGKTMALNVSHDYYARMPVGTTLLMRTHPGALGFEWIEGFGPWQR